VHTRSRSTSGSPTPAPSSREPGGERASEVTAHDRPGARTGGPVDLPAPHDPNLAITPDGASVILTCVFDLPDNGSRGELYRVANPVAPK